MTPGLLGKVSEQPDGGISTEATHDVERGRVTVSWYDGTTSLELYEHVRNSVARKLQLSATNKLSDVRILDEGSSPPEGKSMPRNESCCTENVLTQTPSS